MAKEQPTNQFIGVKSGLFTGPSANIGGSTEYHVDVKFVDLHAKGDYATIVQMMDAIALGYKRNGQRMEFSNEGVSGKVWDPSLPQAQKEALAKQAIDSHNHSSSTGSMDFYIVADKEQNRFADSVLSAREMIMPVPQGGKIVYGTSAGYGNSVAILDASGKEIFTMGHGDNTKPLPEPKTFDITPQYLATQGSTIASTPPNTNSWLGSEASKQPVTGLPTEEQVKKKVEKEGAEKTFDMFSNLFGEGQGGGGGLIMMLFVMVMAAAGKKVDEEKSQTEQGRRDQLREADRANGVDIPISPSTPSNVPSRPTAPSPFNLATGIEIPSLAKSGVTADNSLLLPPIKTPIVATTSTTRETLAIS